MTKKRKKIYTKVKPYRRKNRKNPGTHQVSGHERKVGEKTNVREHWRQVGGSGIDRNEYRSKLVEMKDELFDKLENFKKNNEPFHFNKKVVDPEGNEAFILVDFSIADFEDDDYYVASVTGRTANGESFDDWTYIDAFLDATDIVEGAVKDAFGDQGYMEWDTFGTDMFNPEEGKFDASVPIIWSSMSGGSRSDESFQERWKPVEEESTSEYFKRAMVGDIPGSLEEAIIHDLIGTAQGLIPGVPEPAGMIRTGRMATHEHLSQKAKSMGTTMQGADVVLSAVDPTSLSDLFFTENTLWFIANKEEIEELKKKGKLQGGYGQEGKKKKKKSEGDKIRDKQKEDD